MPYAQNIAFTSLIKISGRLREFNFRRRSETLYDVDTNDERGDRYFFNVEKLNEQWSLRNSSSPTWLTQNELLITPAIIKQEQEISNSVIVSKKE
ncbi:MAG: hypothetical protein ABI675_30995 [Chitinophagaceae bacterium]